MMWLLLPRLRRSMPVSRTATAKSKLTSREVMVRSSACRAYISMQMTTNIYFWAFMVYMKAFPFWQQEFLRGDVFLSTARSRCVRSKAGARLRSTPSRRRLKRCRRLRSALFCLRTIFLQTQRQHPRLHITWPFTYTGHVYVGGNRKKMVTEK